MNRILHAVFLCLALVYPSSKAHAFKVDVHIWIANQILRDLQDGDIDLDIGGVRRSFTLSVRYRTALLNNPQAFLLGSIGPDAFPDVVSGQLVIHPSTPSGWGTAEWIQQLLDTPNLTGEELAFALGFAVHAATDIFAHTYVNRYAGDLFDLGAHPWAAIRHIHIESFISNHTPPLILSSGRRVSPAAAILGDSERLRIPLRLIVDRLLLDPTAIEQMRRSGAAPHLTLTYDLYRSLTKFTDDQGALMSIEASVLKLIAEAKLGIPIAEEAAKEVQKLVNGVNRQLNEASADVGKVLQDANTELAKIQGVRNELVAKGMITAVDVVGDYLQLQIKIARLTTQVVELQQKVQSLPTTVSVRICSKLPLLKEVCSFADKVNPQRISVQIALDLARRTLDSAERDRQNLLPKAKQAIREGLDVIQAQLTLQTNLTNALIAAATDMPFGSPLRNYFERWRENIPVVLGEFAKANGLAILNSVDPTKPSILKPVQQWLVCYGPGLGSVPVKVTSGICVVWDGVDDIRKEFEEFERSLAALTPLTDAIAEAKAEVEKQIDEIRDEVLGIATEQILKEFDRIADANTTELYKALTEHVGAAELNDVMGRDPSGEGLLLIPDAADRISAEMHLAGGKFDPVRFRAIYNATVMAKLSLFERPNLIKLARDAGVVNSRFGRHLFGDTSRISDNILLGFVRSIDGNHQWHDLAPPHPRQDGYAAGDFRKRAIDPDARYSYSDNSCPRRFGMRLWADANARARLFEKLFRGPLVPGVDAPHSLSVGFSSVLPAGYPRLFRSKEWEDDGRLIAPWSEPKTFSLLLEGSNSKARTVELFSNGRLLSKGTYAADGTLKQSFELTYEGAPLQLFAVEFDARGKAVGAVSAMLGCGGMDADNLLSAETAVEVYPGDNLWNLSQSITGSGARWVDLFKANRSDIDDPHKIYPGQTFRLPWSANLRLTVSK